MRLAMQVYHFTSAVHALSNIEKRRLKIAELSKLNDPFEWAAPAFHSKEDRWAMKATKTAMGKQVGIICFSANWRNPVQWSHYAEHHKGICLGFEVADEHLTPITYQADRPEIESLAAMRRAGNLSEDWLQKMICIKFEHWAYEEEHRVFVQLDQATKDGGMYFKKFGQDMRLNKVIVGPASPVTRAQLSEALGSLSQEVEAMKARLAFKTFEVCQQLNVKQWS